MSIRRRLLLTLSGTFILLWSLAAIWLLGDLRKEVSYALDERLASSARMVAGLLEQLPPPLLIPSNPLATDQLGIPDGLVCQVNSLRGEVLVHTPSSPSQALASHAGGFSETSVDADRWRTFTLTRNQLMVTTADRMEEREALERSILIAAALPVLLALLGSLVLIWLGIGQGLAPLKQLRHSLAQRSANDLAPLPLKPLPHELAPLVDTLNQLFARIEDLLARERRFTGDAAHELRTPLTAIKTHLQLAQMTSGEQSQVALTKAEHGVERLQRTLEQLLLLARVEATELFENEQGVLADQVVRVSLSELTNLQPQRIQLDNQLQQPVRLALPESLAVIALRNLLENALRYSHQQPITLTLSQIEQDLIFEVKDQGLSLDQQQLAQMHQRFWRASNQQGSGLGLAIVQAITDRYQGQLSLSSNQPQGLIARLYLPILTTADS